MNTAHPHEDDWLRLAEGRLSAAERTALGDHVVDCGECLAVYRAVADVRAAARRLSSAPPSWPGRRFVLPAIGLAAAVVLAVASAMPRVAPPGSAAVTTTSAPSPSVAPAPGPRAWAAAVTAPDVRLPPSLTMTMRGANADRARFLTAFGAAIAPYRAADYGAAARQLAEVTTAHPDVAEAWFYLGASRLLADEPALAAEPLRRAYASSVVGDEARWLAAVALERAGDAGGADVALRDACDRGGASGATACTALGGR
jgi:hypothetical protein